MNYFIFALGIFILIISSLDLIKTALSVNGAGFISKRLAKAIWKILLVLNKHVGKRKILEMSGAIILMTIVINWLLLIWFSASLLFISNTNSLMNVETNTSTTVVNKIFYAGYTLSTLGLGDIEPEGPFWDILTAILSLTGLILISVAITYLIPVVTAEIEKRKISVYITTIGCSVEEILINYWNGSDFKQLDQPFICLTDMIIRHAQNHKAYSVLHFFHTSDKKEAFVLNIANLDEVLTILLHNIPEVSRPSKHALMGLRRAISSYLITLPSVFIKPSEEIPPIQRLNKLEEMNIPVLQNKDIELAYNNLSRRRSLLLALIKDDGWNWDDIHAGEYDHEISIF